MRKVTIRVPRDAELEVVREDEPKVDLPSRLLLQYRERVDALRTAIDYALEELRGVLNRPEAAAQSINAVIRKLSEVVEGPAS